MTNMSILENKDILQNICLQCDSIGLKKILLLSKKIYNYLFDFDNNLVFYNNLVFDYNLLKNPMNNKKKIIFSIGKINDDIPQNITGININDPKIEIKKLDHILTKSFIKEIFFHHKFNKQIGYYRENFLPDHIEKIIFGDDFNCPLGYDPYYPQNFLCYIYDSVNYLSNLYNVVFPTTNINVTRFLPQNLKELKFGYSFNQKICNPEHISTFIPFSVEKIEFGYSFNQSITFGLPQSLLYLKFGYSFNQPIQYSPLGSLLYLKFDYSFNQEIGDISCSYLPDGLKYLSFGFSFNQEIGDTRVNYLPDGLKYLSFGFSFNQPLYAGFRYLLPRNLEELVIGCHYIEIFDEIPETIKKINFIDCNNVIVKTIYKQVDK